jgi:hypothetical protein
MATITVQEYIIVWQKGGFSQKKYTSYSTYLQGRDAQGHEEISIYIISKERMAKALYLIFL